jgi:hypothetical protein
MDGLHATGTEDSEWRDKTEVERTGGFFPCGFLVPEAPQLYG